MTCCFQIPCLMVVRKDSYLDQLKIRTFQIAKHSHKIPVANQFNTKFLITQRGYINKLNVEMGRFWFVNTAVLSHATLK
jgi:hypothetical protein